MLLAGYWRGIWGNAKDRGRRMVASAAAKCAQLSCVLVFLAVGALAERIGITFQQVQNYEVGKSRITIGRLTRIAKALHVPPAFFFGREAKATVAFSKKSHQLLAATGAVRLMSAYDRLPTEQRAAFVVLVEGIANRKACG